MPFVRRPFALFTALALACVPVAASAMHVGDAAVSFSLPRVDGKGNLDLAKFKGKPVYLNFFASWCGPCNDEAAGIGQFYKKYHPKGLVTIGIDSNEDPADGLGFSKKYAWTFASVSDRGGEVTNQYGGLGLPVHVFIDRHGNVSTYRLGQMSPGEIDGAIKKIL